MTKQDLDILYYLLHNTYVNQRDIAAGTGVSLGFVNNAIKKLINSGLLNNDMSVAKTTYDLVRNSSPKSAIILAAGCGVRMVPLNTENPKGLLEVNGEKLIERLINQLHEVGITKIYVVVGYMKERYEYLIDKFGVELIVNSLYSVKNNLYSLYLASKNMSNTYIVPSSIWCSENPFKSEELYSWYMLSEAHDNKSYLVHNRKKETVLVPRFFGGDKMLGLAYISGEESNTLKKSLKDYVTNQIFDEVRWEEVFFKELKQTVFVKKVHPSECVEINTYEELRELSKESKQLNSKAIETIAEVFKVEKSEITGIKVLKKGMTNKSFVFTCKGDQYIMRIPGEGTDKLINRQHEANVYRTIAGKKLCDDPVYINPDNGYKITRYIKSVRVANPNLPIDVVLCMKKLKAFHAKKLQVDFDFDIYKNIEFYESLWEGKPSLYEDYKTTKENVLKLRPFIENNIEEKVLTHIDAVPDNFLFDLSKITEMPLQLTDWEYAGMQDPHVDIAMFCIYSLYDKKHVDKVIEIYFGGKCPKATHAKIYCYIATCGLLWSNWCEYKSKLGIEFGEYSLRQYRYAKDYYRYACEEIEGLEND